MAVHSPMAASEDLERLRAIRSNENTKLKPSPYLRSSYHDEYGDEHPVHVRNYQAQAIMNLLQMERMILGDDTGLGKAQPIDAKVLTPTGWIEIGKLKIGDNVIGCNGKPTKVIGVFPQGQKQIFRITTSDNASTECCEDHLWTVRTGNTRRSGDGWRTFSLKHMMGVGLKRQQSSYNSRRWYIPIPDPIQFSKKKLPVDPYLVGVLLGDGSLPGTVSVTNGDPDLFDLVRERLPSDCRFGKLKSDGYTIPIIGKPGIRNSLAKGLHKIGIMHKNWYTKFIPFSYLHGSIFQRVELLRGLMDTDGYISKDGKTTKFYSSNSILVNDFIHLVRSLGGSAKIKSKIPRLGINSKAKNGRLAYTISVCLPNNIVPFSLPRKVARWKPRDKYQPVRSITSIEPTRVSECVCIRVDANDHLYVTDDFIVTHNTLEALSAIGYIWLVEPDYVPIIITTKSSLFQWEAEVRKFMHGMEAVTVYGEPHKRHAAYEEFFLNHTPDKKRLLLLTYDMIMYDMEASVIKSKGKSPRPGFAKELKDAKANRKSVFEASEALKGAVKDKIATASFEVQEYAKYLAALWFEKGLEEVPTEAPAVWPQELTPAIAEYIRTKRGLKEHEEKVAALKNEYAPPKTVPGIIDYVVECQKLHPSVKYMLVVDEIQKCKNHKSQFHEKTKRVADISTRCVGMTATPVKNRLMEFFGIFRVIQPKLFPKITHFQNAFCVTKLQRISGGRQIPIVVGYRNLDEFVRVIEPYYLSRKKHDVAKELPELISREVECELSLEQEELYDMAESGAENVDPSIEDSSSEILKALTLCQQAANAPQLILDHEGVPFEGESSKIKTLLDFLEEDASEQKVIVFSRFEKMISLVEKRLNEHKINNVRITGKEDDPRVRQKNREKFQDQKSGINVILITTAGSESLNLQSAEHFVFLDLPWSWGDYVQLIGRMIRIGSIYTTVIAHHYLSRRGDGEKTIDHHVLKALRSKKNLADKVAGANIQDGLKFAEGDILRDVLSMMRSGRQSTPEFKEKSVLAAHPIKKKSASVKKKSSSGSVVEDNISYPPDFSDL